MSDENSSIVGAVDDVETSQAPDPEWLSARRTTAEQIESSKWVAERNQDIFAKNAIKVALGQEFESYRGGIDALSSDERLNLIDKDGEEISAYLERRAEAERDKTNREEANQRRAAEQVETDFAARETPQLKEARKAMKAAYQDAAGLDARIAELQRLNELRTHPEAEEWDKLSAEQWRQAREGTLESSAGEIAALLQEKQTKLQEAALHQSAYHEGARAMQSFPGPPPNMPIGQVIGNDGQPLPITRDDISRLVQLERDEQAHQSRALEAAKRYPDYDAAFARSAHIPLGPGQGAFIVSLPNSADVAYYLATHHEEALALARTPNHDAIRALVNISHKVAQPNPEPRRTTSAPKPPTPVSGGSSRSFDVNDESLAPDDWFAKRNADLQRRGKL